ncbi:uncharacterized protein DUF3515 [Frigoribacterium sp. PhB160]|nr:uncharacterized protein DUF3515 [Frigoribacterium sp. PhB160]
MHDGSLDPMSSPARRLRLPLLVALAALLAPAVAGCTAAVPMTAAADANDPDCAQVVVHLPEEVGPESSPYDIRETDAQSTGAWGTPTAVLLRCGVEAPAVSDLPCYPINGVDWLVDQAQDDPDTFVFTTYGRTPAVEVIVTAEVGSTVLFDLADAVGYLPGDGRACVGAGDLPGAGTDGEPSATPTS